MKWLLIIFIAASCNHEQTSEQAATLSTEVKVKKVVEFAGNDTAPKGSSVSGEDNFEDLKAMEKDDGSCDSEEEIEKELTKKKQEAFKLNGGDDEGCAIQ